MGMGRLDDMLGAIPEVYDWLSERTTYHGQAATKVLVWLVDGRTVEGTFTTEDKDSFGGVTFSQRKDVPALMASKVLSVIAGTAEE